MVRGKLRFQETGRWEEEGRRVQTIMPLKDKDKEKAMHLCFTSTLMGSELGRTSQERELDGIVGQLEGNVNPACRFLVWNHYKRN